MRMHQPGRVDGDDDFLSCLVLGGIYAAGMIRIKEKGRDNREKEEEVYKKNTPKRKDVPASRESG